MEQLREHLDGLGAGSRRRSRSFGVVSFVLLGFLYKYMLCVLICFFGSIWFVWVLYKLV